MIAAAVILWIMAILASLVFTALIADLILLALSTEYRRMQPGAGPNIGGIAISGLAAAFLWALISLIQ